MDEEGQEAVFRRMTKELPQVYFNHDLPSPEERANGPSSRTIECEQLCNRLDIPLPFDKNTAGAGEVCDAWLSGDIRSQRTQSQRVSLWPRRPGRSPLSLR